jgi:DNA-binding MarR family transcriptional regulator
MTEPTDHDRLMRLARTCACNNIRRASRAITNYYDSLFLAACGLRSTQTTSLVVLYLGGAQTVNALAGQLGLDRTTLTRNLKLLAGEGLLTIEPGQDQRTRLVTLTKRGTSRLLKALPIWEDAQAHMENGLGEARFSALLTQLSAIAELTRAA